MPHLHAAIIAAIGVSLSGLPMGTVRQESVGSFATLKLTPCDPTPESKFGYSVAVDGNTIAVGDIGAPLGGNGRVCVYEGNPSGTTVLSPTQSLPDSSYGITVAIEGDTIAVGGELVYVYRRLAQGSWIEEHVIPSASHEVALRAGTLAISAASQVVLYRRNQQGLWIKTDTITAPLGVSDFGTALSLGDDLLLVGAVESAVVYRKTSNGWQHAATLKSDLDSSGGFFGTTGFGVDVVLWRGAAYIGSWGYGNSESGAVLVFAPTGGQWHLVEKILPRRKQWAQGFGSSFCINEDGLFIGASNENTRQAEFSGVVHHFKQVGPQHSWALIQQIAPDPQPSASFGFSVSCASGVLVVGAIDADVGGAAYCIDL